MARGSDPESRPISVAELLARAKEQGADDVASTVAGSPAATGRRRRGGKDAVSVAELTGEMPRVTAQPKADPVSQPKADPTSQSEAGSATDEVKPPAVTTPPPTRDFNTADVSKRAAEQVGPGDRPTPGAPDRPAPFRAKAATPESVTSEPVAPESVAPETSDAGASSDRAAETGAAETGAEETRDEETTGVIPSMQAYSQVGGDGDHRVLSAAEREREFERYRNFEDVEAGEGDSASSSGTKKKKRGLFGFGRKAAAEPTPVAGEFVGGDDAGGESGDISDHTVTQLIPKVADETPEPATAAERSSGRYLRFDLDTDQDSSRQDSSRQDIADGNAADGDTADGDTAKSVVVADESATSEFGRVRDTAAADAPLAVAETDAVGTVKTSLVKPVAAISETAISETGTSESGPEATNDPDRGTTSAAETPPAADERSAAVQWLLLIGQVVAGLAVGVALFWGFTELWRWNVLFALVLSVAVIFGLVTLVLVVRRSNDLISTLLALGVGLLVTIGPLVLLLIVGD